MPDYEHTEDDSFEDEYVDERVDALGENYQPQPEEPTEEVMVSADEGDVAGETILPLTEQQVESLSGSGDAVGVGMGMGRGKKSNGVASIPQAVSGRGKKMTSTVTKADVDAEFVGLCKFMKSDAMALPRIPDETNQPKKKSTAAELVLEAQLVRMQAHLSAAQQYELVIQFQDIVTRAICSNEASQHTGTHSYMYFPKPITLK